MRPAPVEPILSSIRFSPVLKSLGGNAKPIQIMQSIHAVKSDLKRAGVTRSTGAFDFRSICSSSCS